jgi:hypothetical protein
MTGWRRWEVEESAAVARKLRLDLVDLGRPLSICVRFVGLDVGGDHLGNGAIFVTLGGILFKEAGSAVLFHQRFGLAQEPPMLIGLTPRV